MTAYLCTGMHTVIPPNHLNNGINSGNSGTGMNRKPLKTLSVIRIPFTMFNKSTTSLGFLMNHISNNVIYMEDTDP